MDETCAFGERYRELLPDFAAGSLEGDDARDLEKHVHSCRPCAIELAQLEASIDLVMEPVIEHAVAEHDAEHQVEPVRQEIAAALQRERGRGRIEGTRAQRVGLVTFALAALCGVLIAIAIRDNPPENSTIDGRSEIVRLVDLEDSKVAVGTGVGVLKHATIVIASDKEAGFVVLRELPAPQAGHGWAVWQVDTRHRLRRIGILRRAVKKLYLPLESGTRPIRRVFITSETVARTSPRGDVLADARIR